MRFRTANVIRLWRNGGGCSGIAHRAQRVVGRQGRGEGFIFASGHPSKEELQNPAETYA